MVALIRLVKVFLSREDGVTGDHDGYFLLRPSLHPRTRDIEMGSIAGIL
jgi:hypothetical protein